MAAGKTFYDILGVSKSASDKEIKSAFRDENGLMKKGVIVRHLLLPGAVKNAKLW